MVCEIFFSSEFANVPEKLWWRRKSKRRKKGSGKALSFSSKRNEYEHGLVKIKDQLTLGARTSIGYEFTWAEFKESVIEKATITMGERLKTLIITTLKL